MLGKVASVKSNTLQNHFSESNNCHWNFPLDLSDLWRHQILFPSPFMCILSFSWAGVYVLHSKLPYYPPDWIIIYCPFWPHNVLKFFHHYDTLVLIKFMYYLVQTLHLALQSWSNWSQPPPAHGSLIQARLLPTPERTAPHSHHQAVLGPSFSPCILSRPWGPGLINCPLLPKVFHKCILT